tara:strand:- start:253 stop:687 length:435 start_codon:yes stop_codon:yes gene_type:complete
MLIAAMSAILPSHAQDRVLKKATHDDKSFVEFRDQLRRLGQADASWVRLSALSDLAINESAQRGKLPPLRDFCDDAVAYEKKRSEFSRYWAGSNRLTFIEGHDNGPDWVSWIEFRRVGRRQEGFSVPFPQEIAAFFADCDGPSS